MKIVTFLHNGKAGYGVTDGDRVTPPSVEFAGRFPDLRSVLRHGALADLQADTTGAVKHLGIDALTLLPPIPNPGKIVCVGMNYRKPYPVDGVVPPAPDNIILFGRERETLVGHGQPLQMPTGLAAESFDYEAEIALIIGKSGRHIPLETAVDHIAGYTLFNDGSVRDWQKHSIYAGKNFEGSGSCGPWMTTADEIGDLDQIQLTTRLNGEVKQQAFASEMIFSIAEQIAYISQVMTLTPGDIIATGSPDGTGGSRTPKRYLLAGDGLEITATGLGKLMSFLPQNHGPSRIA